MFGEWVLNVTDKKYVIGFLIFVISFISLEFLAYSFAEDQYISSISYDGNDLLIGIESSSDVAGVEISINSDYYYAVSLKDNSHISQVSNFIIGVNYYLEYSMFNQAFDGNVTDIFISSSGHLSKDDIVITVADINGDKLTLTYG